MSQQNRTKMSVTQLTLLTAINMMGSGIVMLPTKLAEIGTISILSWLITAVGSLCLAYAFAKCGMFSKRPGMGGYSEYAFGKAGNFMANYTYGVSLLFANIAIAITCVGYGAEFLEIELTPVQVCLSTIVVLWICTSANFMGASLTGKFSALAVLRHPSRVAFNRYRLVLVQSYDVCRSLESAQRTFLLRCRGFNLYDAMGLLRT